MNDSTLLLPDTGPEFLRALRFASLYSETVYVFTLTKPETSRRLTGLADVLDQAIMRQLKDLAEGSPDIAEKLNLAKVLEGAGSQDADPDPAEEFLQFTLDASGPLALLEKENVLRSITEELLADFPQRQQMVFGWLETFKEALEAATKQISKAPEELRSLVRDGWQTAPSSVFSLVEVLFHIAIDYGHSSKRLSDELYQRVADDPELLARAAYGFYLLISSYLAVTNGWSTVTWHLESQHVLEWCNRFLAGGVPAANELLLERRRTKNRLGHVVLEEEVPNVTELPFEEILRIRDRRASELQAFRAGLAELAADIDPSLDTKALELAIDSKVQKIVKPALRELNAAIAELQLDAYNRLLHPTKELAVASIPVAISYAAGAALELPAVLGAVGVLLSKCYEFLVGRAIAKKKLLASNSWSVLLRLQARLPK